MDWGQAFNAAVMPNSNVGNYKRGGYLCRMIKVVLKRKIAQRIASRHPWIFGNEINTIEPAAIAGDIVDVYYHDDKFCGGALSTRNRRSWYGCLPVKRGDRWNILL